MTCPTESSSFTLGYVPGTTPGKWVRKWEERVRQVPLHLVQVSAAGAADLVRDREADAVLLRLPTDRTGLHAIPLYTETTVVIAPKDHLVTAADELSLEELADEVLLHPEDDVFDWAAPPGRPAIERPVTTGDAMEWVAASVGLLVVPQSLARLHHRKDLTYRPIIDAPQSRVALSWPEEETSELMEHFIGIVRGRTVNSTRGVPTETTTRAQDRKPTRSAPQQQSRRSRASRAPGRGKRGKPRR